jgi:hypothetical protein
MNIKSRFQEEGRRNFLKYFGTSMAGISLSGIFPGEKVFGALPASKLVMF